MIKITPIFCKWLNFIFAFNMHLQLYIAFIYSILHILHSYIAYLHLDQTFFDSFSSGKSKVN